MFPCECGKDYKHKHKLLQHRRFGCKLIAASSERKKTIRVLKKVGGIEKLIIPLLKSLPFY